MSPRGSLPLADARLLARAARRTAAARVALAIALVAALAIGALLVGRGGAAQAARDGAARHTIVVLDLSGSVSGSAYERVGVLLESLAHGSGPGDRVGLVLFSDIAEEALPPETRPSELLAYARYFRPDKRKSGDDVLSSPYPDNPWMTTFSRGTTISAGLALARRLVARDRLGSARVLLVSDLFDSTEDAARLKTEALAYARLPHVQLRILPLPPFSGETLRMLERNVGQRHVTISPTAPPRVAAEGPGRAFPAAFVAVVALLALALAANEIVGATFRWSEEST